MNETPSTASLLVSLVPLFVAALTVALMITIIAPRKGKSPALALLSLIPFVNMIVVVLAAVTHGQGSSRCTRRAETQKCLTRRQSQRRDLSRLVLVTVLAISNGATVHESRQLP